jgi:hypothetical protein
MLNFKTNPKLDGITAGNLVRKSNSMPTFRHKLVPLYPKSSELFFGGGGRESKNKYMGEEGDPWWGGGMMPRLRITAVNGK